MDKKKKKCSEKKQKVPVATALENDWQETIAEEMNGSGANEVCKLVVEIAIKKTLFSVYGKIFVYLKWGKREKMLPVRTEWANSYDKNEKDDGSQALASKCILMH